MPAGKAGHSAVAQQEARQKQELGPALASKPMVLPTERLFGGQGGGLTNMLRFQIMLEAFGKWSKAVKESIKE